MEANNAAMREALEKAKKAICHHAAHICQSLSWENSNLQSNCADVLCAHRELCEAKTAINSALATPPRNCGRFAGEEEARGHFLAECWEEHYDPRIYSLDSFPRELLVRYVQWLFATTEWKGEGDGSK